jgi:hypothetical protein
MPRPDPIGRALARQANVQARAEQLRKQAETDRRRAAATKAAASRTAKRHRDTRDQGRR